MADRNKAEKERKQWLDKKEESSSFLSSFFFSRGSLLAKGWKTKKGLTFNHMTFSETIPQVKYKGNKKEIDLKDPEEDRRTPLLDFFQLHIKSGSEPSGLGKSR